VLLISWTYIVQQIPKFRPNLLNNKSDMFLHPSPGLGGLRLRAIPDYSLFPALDPAPVCWVNNLHPLHAQNTSHSFPSSDQDIHYFCSFNTERALPAVSTDLDGLLLL
jgi:hypothetical protein